MDYINITTYTFLFIFLLGIQEISSESGSKDKPSEVSQTGSNPLLAATLIADKNVIENVNNSNKLADEVLSRVKRFYYPYYYGRYYRYPPIPIIIGGGFGIGGIGFGKGYGGRGFGGRGFGGKGFGGRGFGGRGIGGRGFGGRAGGFGGGRGGRG